MSIEISKNSQLKFSNYGKGKFKVEKVKSILVVDENGHVSELPIDFLKKILENNEETSNEGIIEDVKNKVPDKTILSKYTEQVFIDALAELGITVDKRGTKKQKSEMLKTKLGVL